MSDNPFDRPERNFRSAVEKISRRLRAEVQRATKQMQTAETAMERAKADIDLATREFQTEMARARAELEADLKRARTKRAEMDPAEVMRAVVDLKHARDELRGRRAAAPRGRRGWREIRGAQEHVEQMIERVLKSPPKRRPRRDLDDGGLPVPVEPRPNPTPLVDGAEAPIE